MSATEDAAAPAPILNLNRISLAFGGVTVLDDVSFDIREGEIRAIIGPNGAGKSSMLNVINGFYHPDDGTITFKGRDAAAGCRPDQALPPWQGMARTFQNVALFRGHEHAGQRHGRAATRMMRRNFLWPALLPVGPAQGGRRCASPGRRPTKVIELPRDRGHPQRAGGPPALRPAEAGGARPGARRRARSAPARRAHGRDEPERKGGDEPLHPRRPRRASARRWR